MKRHGSRGQALPEFAITITLLVSAMMFIFAVARFGVISERAASALRIAGIVTQNENPYRFASLDTIYQAANNTYSAANDQGSCTTPDAQILYGKGMLVGAASANFWNPSAIPIQPTCQFSMKTFNGTALRTTEPLLVHEFDYAITANAAGWTSQLAQSAGTMFGGPSQTVAQTARFFQAPSLETLMQCYSRLGPAVSATLNPAKDVGNADETAPITQGEANGIRSSTIIAPLASCQQMVMAEGPYQVPPAPLPFPANSGATNVFSNQTNGSSSSGSSTSSKNGSTHGSYSHVDAYSTPVPPIVIVVTPPPSKNGSGSSTPGSPGSGSVSTPKPIATAKPVGKPTPVGSNGSSSTSTGGSNGSSSPGSGSSGSGSVSNSTPKPASTSSSSSSNNGNSSSNSGSSSSPTSSPGSSNSGSTGTSSPTEPPVTTNDGSGSGTINL